MRTRTIASLTATCLLLSALEAGAPIFGFFPGLTKLIDRADVVVVAKVKQQTGQGDIGGGAIFSIEILRTLKGEAKPGTVVTAYLRNLPFRSGELGTYTALQKGTAPGDRRILFLNKADPDEKFAYRNENASGDSLAITSQFDLNRLDGKSVREQIAEMLNDVVAREEDRLKELKQVVDLFLKEK